jgi:hypothetical protein
MSGINYYNAETVNASTAGLTHTNRPRILSTDLGASPTEMLGNVATNIGGLGFLFGHSVTDVVSTALHPATDSIKTALGGFTPPHHVVAAATPQPVDGTPELGTSASPTLPTVFDTVKWTTNETAVRAKELLQTLRTNLGI